MPMSSAIFNFDPQKVFAQSVEINDIGNCAIKCTNPDFDDFYICTQTAVGKTFILKFGPISTDIEELGDEFNLSYKKINYKEKVIEKEINLFINDGKKKINHIEVISLSDMLEAVPTSEQFIPE